MSVGRRGAAATARSTPRSTAKALFALGLRPFYLAAGIFAALAVPVWFAAYNGWLVPGGALPGAAWHAHEMLFGFAPAVVAGFLLAAVRNWTNLPTPTGWALASLLTLWLAGRIAMIAGPQTAALVIDSAFLPVLAVTLGVPLWRARNRRNFFIPVVIVVLAAANLAFHLAYDTRGFPIPPPVAVSVAAGALACLMAVVAGRVIPAFAANAIQGLGPRRWPALEILAVGALVLIALIDAASMWWVPPGGLLSALLWIAAAAHVVRLLGWKPWAMRGNLLLMILPISYCWIPVYLVLRASAFESGGVLPPLALHALLIGAMGGLMLSMMTRSALGHTGRALQAGPREAGIFLAIHAAALVRVAFPAIWPADHALWVAIASLLWTVAFAAFTVGYWPVLTRPRVDGRPG